MVTSEEKELAINSQLEAVEDCLEDGPEDGEAPEAFLKRLSEEADTLKGAIKALTPDDVDEIWVENDEEIIDAEVV